MTKLLQLELKGLACVIYLQFYAWYMDVGYGILK
jgi:hypothetical protein